MARVHDSIEVVADPRKVFTCWTRFDIYPEFLTGIEAVHHRGNGRLSWRGYINGALLEWETEVTELVLDARLAWSGPQHVNDMIVDIHRTEFGTTRLTVDAELEPVEATTEAVTYLEAATRRLHLDLERFREWLRLGPAVQHMNMPPRPFVP